MKGEHIKFTLFCFKLSDCNMTQSEKESGEDVVTIQKFQRQTAEEKELKLLTLLAEIIVKKTLRDIYEKGD